MARHESRLPCRLRPAAAGLIILLAASGVYASQLSVPLPVGNYHLLLNDAYPIETLVSFHGSLLHWMDSLAGLNGAGMTAGKTERAHRIEFNHILGPPTERDREVLLGFARARIRFATDHAAGDIDALTVAFFEADTQKQALAATAALLTDEELQDVRTAFDHFTARYREVWKDGTIPQRFLQRSARHKRRNALSRFLVKVADFYGVSPHQKPYPQVVLMPVVDGAGTHAQAIGRHLLLEIRHWEDVIDETAPLVHENAHLLFLRMDPRKVERFVEIAEESSDVGLEAWQVLREALPTALGQGLAYEKFLPERWSLDLPWYDREVVDHYAKRLYPLVKRAFERGGNFDESFLRRALAVYPSSMGPVTPLSP